MEVQIKFQNVNVSAEQLNIQVVITYISKQNVIFEAQTILGALINDNNTDDQNMFLYIPFKSENNTFFDIKVIDQFERIEFTPGKPVECKISGLIFKMQSRHLSTYKTLQLFSLVEGVSLDGALTDQLIKTLDPRHLQMTTCYALNSNWNYLVTCNVNQLDELILPLVSIEFLNTFLSIRYRHSFIFLKTILSKQEQYEISMNKFIIETILDGISDENNKSNAYTIINFERTAKQILQHTKDASSDQIIMKIQHLCQTQRESLIQKERNEESENEFHKICLQEDNSLNKHVQFAYIVTSTEYKESQTENEEYQLDPITEAIYPQGSSLIVYFQIYAVGSTSPFTIPKHTAYETSDSLDAKLFLDVQIALSTENQGISKYELVEQAIEKTKDDENLIQQVNIPAFQLIEKPLFNLRIPNGQQVLIYVFEEYRDALRLLVAKKELQALYLEKKLAINTLKLQQVIISDILLVLYKQKYQLYWQKHQESSQNNKSYSNCQVIQPKPILRRITPLPLKKIQKPQKIQYYVPFSLQVQQNSRIYSKKIEQAISDVLWFFRQRMTIMTKSTYKHQLTQDIMSYMIEH